MHSKLRATISTTLWIGLVAGVTGRAGAEAPAPKIKEVMQHLGHNAEGLIRALMIEDFKAIAEAAEGVAGHAVLPPEEVQAISKALGSDMPKFKKFDTDAHHAAEKVVEAAKAKKIEGVMANVPTILGNCVGCHTAFRTKVQAALKK